MLPAIVFDESPEKLLNIIMCEVLFFYMLHKEHDLK